MHASRMATGGLLLLGLLQTVTAWVRPRRLSSLRITIPAGTVLPFAVWYGSGVGSDRKVNPRRRASHRADNELTER